MRWDDRKGRSRREIRLEEFHAAQQLKLWARRRRFPTAESDGPVREKGKRWMGAIHAVAKWVFAAEDSWGRESPPPRVTPALAETPPPADRGLACKVSRALSTRCFFPSRGPLAATGKAGRRSRRKGLAATGTRSSRHTTGPAVAKRQSAMPVLRELEFNFQRCSQESGRALVYEPLPRDLSELTA
jgi:hypothetical protein